MARSGEKSEKPTEKRLRESRRKGQVAKSHDLTSSLLLVGAALVVALAGRWMGMQLSATMRDWIDRAARFSGELDPAKGIAALSSALASLGVILAPLFVALVLIALVFNYIQVGPIFAFEPIKPKLNKLNPAESFKQKFLTARPYIELVKTLVKMGITAFVILAVIWSNRANIVELTRQPVPIASHFAANLIFQMVIEVGAAFLVLGALDFLLQRLLHMKDLKMSKHEVKDEYKETEGNPLHKSVRRNRHREILMQNLIDAIKKATVVVVNPTHVAVALNYDSTTMGAPTVVAKGADLMAAHLRRLAAEAHVPMMRDVVLARSLYEVETDMEIPDELYEAVAIVLRWVYQLAEERDEVPSHV